MLSNRSVVQNDLRSDLTQNLERVVPTDLVCWKVLDMSCSTPNLEPQLFTVLEIGGAVVSFAMVSRWFRETNDCPKNKPTYLQNDEELLLMVEKGESPIQYLPAHQITKHNSSPFWI